MIARIIWEIFCISLVVLAGLYVTVWRVKRRLQPAALLLDEGLQSLCGGLMKTTMAKGHFSGRLVTLRIYLGRWARTLIIRMACDSPMDFAIWPSERKGAPRTPLVDGYLVLAPPDFDREFASISRDPSKLLAWVRDPVTKDRLSALANAKGTWRVELHSATLEWTDFGCGDSEFTGPNFSRLLEMLARLASSLEAAAGDARDVATTGAVNQI
jgi:hypothetical protein